MKVPRGFKAAGISCGIKEGAEDLALIYSELEASAWGLFTSNRVKAAPVLYSRRKLRRGRARAIIANSGCANACTGPKGLEDARRMAQAVARTLEIPEGEVLVASTGVIGEPLPIERIEAAVPELSRSLSPEGFEEAARAIMTTDRRPKIRWANTSFGGKEVTVLGIAKGAGMIRPNLATMLAFLVTDAGIDPPLLRGLLREAVSESFNRITVDGDQSTNDTVFLLANGASGPLGEGGMGALREALREVARGLALEIVRDGEGATKVVEIVVRGARNRRDAERAAYRLAHSPLVKTALFGRDPNWGRFMVALGDAGVRIDPARVQIRIDGLPLVKDGVQAPEFDEAKVRELMRRDEFRIEVDLQLGGGSFSLFTCDLSYDYVRINASYRS